MKFTLSNVFNGGFSNLGKAFVPLLVAALALYVGPNLAISAGLQYGLGVTMWSAQSFQGSLIGLSIGAMVVVYVLAFTHMSATYEICILAQANKPIRLGEVIRHAFANALPIFFIYVLCILGWMIGLTLLVIPAFIFGAFYCVVVPAYVAEKPGVFGAFSRSQALTKGHRWAIFGIWVLMIIVFYIALMVIEVPLMAPIFQASFEAAKTGRHYVPQAPNFLIVAVLSVLFSALWVLMLSINASIYSCLRAEKEGFSGARVEKIFE